MYSHSLKRDLREIESWIQTNRARYVGFFSVRQRENWIHPSIGIGHPPEAYSPIISLVAWLLKVDGCKLIMKVTYFA